MASFTFKVEGQHLSRVTEQTVVSDSVNYLSASFTFSDDWEGMHKYVHFTKGTVNYEVELEDDKIDPSEGINLSSGNWKVSIHGNVFDEDDDDEILERITTNVIYVYVEPSGVLSGEPFPTVTASVGEQIVARATAKANAASASATSANTAKTSAETAAQTATTKAGEASTSASQALASKNSASASAQTASTKASEANASAIAAAASAASCEPYDDTEIREDIAELNEGIAQLPQDVKVNGTSILDSDNVANIPVISDALGLAKIDSYYGISANTEGRLYVNKATESEIASRSNGFKPITPANLDYGTKSALTTANTSANAWSDAEKANACHRIGAYNPNKPWVLKGTLTTENKDTGVSVDLSGCTEMMIKGSSIATSSVNIMTNFTHLLYQCTRNGYMKFIAEWRNCHFGINGLFGHSATSDVPYMFNPLNAMSIDDGHMIAEITKIQFNAPSYITSCNIEIYAR